MNISTVNELIQSLESAGELSIREQKFLKLAKAHVQLAAENVALKQAAEFATAPDMWIEQADGMLDYRYHEWYVDVLKAAMETPATDRIYAGIKADGVEEFIGRLQQCVDEGDFVGDEVDVIVGAIDCGKEFCEQLREGADK
ncbi:TPA: hypothetical protein ACQ8R9_004426 [Klebsiella pneumoniae]|nr:hypothetical protein [Klebsiella pneumoniae subsp. pneumoniae]